MSGDDRLRVLVYHRVSHPAHTPGLDPALVSATPDHFRRQMHHLARRYAVVSLDQVLSAFGRRAGLPRRAVLITFDDAYRDFGETAWPILRDLGLPATLFVPTAYPGRPERAFWWDRLHRLLRRRKEPATPAPPGTSDPAGKGRELGISDVRAQMKVLPYEQSNAIVEDLERAFPAAGGSDSRSDVLDWDQIRELSGQGLSVAPHTRWHPPLPRTAPERIRQELRGSLRDLQERLGDVPRVIAYPYGFHDDATVQIAREEGFELGFTCLDGLNRVGITDPLRIRRTNVSRNTTPLLFRIRMRPWFSSVDRWRHRSQDPAGAGAGVSADRLRRALESTLSAAPPSWR